MAKYYKFDSGLVLLYEVNKINSSTDIDIAFDCGARCDGELSGLSHFCEHMFFTGTKTMSKQEVSKRYFDFIKTNAFTNYSEIYFTGSIMTNRLKDYLVAVQDMICNTTCTKDAVEEEKKVVIQEIVRDADQHSRHARRFDAYEMYKLEHFKQGILGDKESVSKITPKDVKNYIKKYFVKNNCIINVCTPLSFNKVKRLVRKYFESVIPSNKLKPLPYMSNKFVTDEKVALYTKDIDKNFLTITFKFNRKGPDLRYLCTLSTIANIMDDISDGLTKELRIDNSLIYGMWADYMVNNVNSYFELGTEVGVENIKPCLDVIFDYISRVRQTGFTKEQFAKELQKEDYYWHTNVETPYKIKSSLTRYRFYGEFVSSKDLHNVVQSLTLDEVNKVMFEMFNDAKIQVFVYGNATKKDIYTIKQIQKKFN